MRRWAARTAPLLLAAAWLAIGPGGPARAEGPPDDARPLEADDPLGSPRFEAVGADVIPRGVVASLAQDAAGFLWVATGDGLVRYDGHRFRPQERDSDDPAARNLGWIRAMLGGRDGRLWIGTESDGLASYDPAADRVVDHGSHAGPAGGQPLPSVRALAQDGDGTVWVGSIGGGLERFDPATGRFTAYRADGRPGALPDDRVVALQVDAAGDLWVGHWQGLARLRRGSERFEPVFADAATGLGGAAVQALWVAADGRLWAGTAQGHLARVDPASGAGEMLRGASPAEPVTAMTQDTEGRVWVGRGAGIDLHAASDGRLLRRLRHDPAQPYGLAGNEVSSLLRDRAGAIWVGGYGGGLQRVDAVQRPLRVRRGEARPDGLFANPDARALLARPDGGLWAATHDGQIVALDAALRVVGPALPGVAPAGRIEALAEAPDGTLWLGSEGTLQAVGRDGREQRRLRHPGGGTNRLLPARDGRLWVGTQDGLYLLRPGAAALARVGLAGGSRLDGDVFALTEAADGALWVGGVRGLWRVEPGGEVPQPVPAAPGAGLGSPIVLALAFDRQGALWLDTAVAGLHRMAAWDGRQARFERVSARHGVLNRPFGVNLLEDARGRIWTHMYVYDPATDHLHELTPADGAVMGTGWFRSFARLADGRLVFGGSRGLLVVEAERFEPPADVPPVVVTDLLVNGAPARLAGLAGGLDIRPGQRQFGVEFAALDYADPRRTRFRYRLDGVDRDWVETGSAYRLASYGNLPPGHYVLQVLGSNRAGVWSPQPLTIPVRVWPAWWQTAWFRTGAALAGGVLLAAAIAALVGWRTRALRRRQAQLEAEVSARTAELRALADALQDKSAQLEQASLTDPLTGLHNRRYLTQHIEADAAIAVRRWSGREAAGGAVPAQADLVFFVIDLDRFKALNDRHGHAAGDAVLRQMHERLLRVFRDSDHLVRWGGEEFLVVARGTDRTHAPALAERLREAVADEPFTLADGTPVGCSVSIGFAAFPLAPGLPGALDWEDTLGVADAALLAVKRHARGQWLGLVSARADTAEALLAALRAPPEVWPGQPGLEVAASAPLAAPGPRTDGDGPAAHGPADG